MAKFRNKSAVVSLGAPVINRRNHPYVSKPSAGSSLTEKERIVRNIQKAASASFGGAGGAGGFGGGDTMQSSQGAFHSVTLSKDFLELPQSLREKRELYRFWYNSNEIVGQAIDLHTELPLSKVRLSAPKPRLAPKGFSSPHDYGRYILSRFERMCKDVKLFRKLLLIVKHYWLDGTVCVWAEDSEVAVPQEVTHKFVKRRVSVLADEPTEVEEDDWEELPDADERSMDYYAKNYTGWKRLVVIPIDRVKVTSYDYTDSHRLELIPSDKDKKLLMQAQQGDPVAIKMAEAIPDEVKDHIQTGGLIPLGTDPDEGSFAALILARNLAGEELGQSILDRCLRTLNYLDKLRQAQTQIASRAMAPKRVVYAEDLSEDQVDDLRAQVDLALVDPDYSIVANYQVNWEEQGSRDRLLDLQPEYELHEKRLITGLGVTESLMSGEALYSGDRLKLEVINQRYIHLREALQEFVEEQLFRPVAERMGFVETDEWGQKVVLFPKLSFTRLPLRDSQDTFDALFNLYQKGSISIDLILEMLNIDPEDTRVKIERDLFTVNDATFNEVLRGVYTEVGRMLTEKTNVMEKIAGYLKLDVNKEPAGDEGGGGGGGRF